MAVKNVPENDKIGEVVQSVMGVVIFIVITLSVISAVFHDLPAMVLGGGMKRDILTPMIQN